MKKTGVSKKVKWFSSVSFILIILVIIWTVVENSSLRNVLDERDKSLDLYEATKLWVMEDIRDYVRINDKASYDLVKSNVHMTKELKSDLFGATYSSLKFIGATNVSFVDMQYSLEDKGTTIYYILANVKAGKEEKVLNFLVFVANNQIYDVIFY